VDAEVIQVKLFCQLHWQLKVVWTLTAMVGGRRVGFSKASGNEVFKKSPGELMMPKKKAVLEILMLIGVEQTCCLSI